MPPNDGDGLVRPAPYNMHDTNIDLIASDLDHKVKHSSAATEPAWKAARAGEKAGLHVWRIEDFAVVPWPADQYGTFFDGDSYIVLRSESHDAKGQHTEQDGDKLTHDVFFWLGSQTSQDEAGTAAYKAVELDEYLDGKAAQHRETQLSPSSDFLGLFPRVCIKRGGVRSGFHHVEEEHKEDKSLLLRIFKLGAGRASHVLVHEVEPTWRSLDEGDVFVLEKTSKIYVWQGGKCSPIEKAKAAQVVNDLTLSKHIDTEVLAQGESRSRIVVDLLGGEGEDTSRLSAARPVALSGARAGAGAGEQKEEAHRLFKLSDAGGTLTFEHVKDGRGISRGDLSSGDVCVLDTSSRIWVWVGAQASREERALWLRVARAYAGHVAAKGKTEEEGKEGGSEEEAYSRPISKVSEGHESLAFVKALEGGR